MLEILVPISILKKEGIMKKLVLALMFYALSFGWAQFSLVEGSEARFYLDEVLLGLDKTVIGVTTEVTGDINFDLSDPQAASMGAISIDASTIATDSSRRDRRIHNHVLVTVEEENQFITLQPTSIIGLPETLAVGDSFEIQIIGDLTISGTTLETTFDVAVTVTSESQLDGLGSAIILHSDFGLSIPSVPSVAFVAEEVKLELAFVASTEANESN